MTSDPFFKPLSEIVPRLGRVSRPKSDGPAPAEAAEPPQTAPAEEKPKPKTAKLSNPRWETDKVGFNEETPISVDVDLPPEVAHKKKVAFELFAKTPKGPERISQGDAMAEDGKATLRIPVYIPNYQDPDGNRLRTVEYYFVARHSEAEPLDGSKTPKLIDEMADRVLESHILQNVTFATGKSFIRTSEAGDLKALGQAVKEWKGRHTDAKLAVFGHADALGEELGNKQLSERRARSVQAYLAKDAKPWEDLYGEEKWGLAAVQELLKHLGYDPGVMDGQDGPKTHSAVKEFQGKKGLGATGTADAKTREALFLAYFESNGSPGSAAKDFDAIDGKAFTGCSEFNLVENMQGACEPNRRVTVLLLKVSKNFPINYPCKQGAIMPCQKQAGLKGERRTAGFKCRFYDGLVVERKGAAPKGAGKIKAFVHSTEKELKQFVNIQGGKGTGKDIELEVEVDASLTRVYWKATAGAKNSKRNKPLPGWMKIGAADATPLKDGIGEFESEVKNGKAKAVFRLGLAGGDEFTFEVGAEEGKKELEQKVVTWRKAWYQVTREKGLTLPAIPNFINAYELAFVGMERAQDVEFEKKDAPPRTFYPQWMVSPGGGDKEVAVIGSHNSAHYRTLLKDVKEEHPKAHIVICQHQFDKGAPSKLIKATLSTRISSTLIASVPLFNPALDGDFLISGSWSSQAPLGHPDHGKTGSLTAADIILEKTRNALEEFKVKVPASVAEPGSGSKVDIEVKLRGVKGPFLGESAGKQILAVYDPSDPIDFQNTITHEMGHAYNQTPGAGDQSPGLAGHPHHYIEHGGTGPHCSTILKDGKEAKGVEVDGPDPENPGKTMKFYDTGICVMFHSGPQPGCLNRYCETCLPYVKATDFSDFGKP